MGANLLLSRAHGRTKAVRLATDAALLPLPLDGVQASHAAERPGSCRVPAGQQRAQAAVRILRHSAIRKGVMLRASAIVPRMQAGLASGATCAVTVQLPNDHLQVLWGAKQVRQDGGGCSGTGSLRFA